MDIDYYGWGIDILNYLSPNPKNPLVIRDGFLYIPNTNRKGLYHLVSVTSDYDSDLEIFLIDERLEE